MPYEDHTWLGEEKAEEGVVVYEANSEVTSREEWSRQFDLDSLAAEDAGER